jgi:outer membrane receptor protein involved in Fe transport
MKKQLNWLLITASGLLAACSIVTVVRSADLTSAKTTNINISNLSSDLIAARQKKRPQVRRKSQPTQTNPVPTQLEYTQIPTPTAPTPAEPGLTVDVIGERRLDLPKSAPVYTIDRQQIDRQGAKNVADALKNLPGFAINDVGYGADIHTGTYYRGASTNQFIILLNGRPIGTNINTYHGATDLNSIPVDAIDRIELSSGASNIIYGSEAFGGVVNIITKTALPHLWGKQGKM